MSNMTVNQRNQFERAELAVPTTGVRVRGTRALVIYSVIATCVLAALVYATVNVINGWAQAIVLGMIILTTVGAMIAVNPLRRA
jgi:hypothetical protein